MQPLNPALAASFAPPVMEARRWMQGVTFAPDQPLINVSQAAPNDPPPAPLRQALAQAALGAEAHAYGPVLGNADLRTALATQISAFYQGDVRDSQIAITQGCNQAFCAAIATLAGPGDEVIVPTPWYFNHKMWLDMSGIAAVPLACGDDALPDPAVAAGLITPRTRAILLVTPNNPTGAEYPPALIDAFYDLCQSKGLALILDETYRDFHSTARPGGAAPHGLFARPGWDDTLIHLYSFSKSLRLMGHRTGAMVASPARLAEAEKWLDTVAISASQMGQIGAVYGITHLADWMAQARAEVLARGQAARDALGGLAGWRLKSCGAYFAWIEHPFAASSADLAPRMLREIGVLALPGTMFVPAGDPAGPRHFRIAFANVDAGGIRDLAARLSRFAA